MENKNIEFITFKKKILNNKSMIIKLKAFGVMYDENPNLYSIDLNSIEIISISRNDLTFVELRIIDLEKMLPQKWQIKDSKYKINNEVDFRNDGENYD